MHPGCFKNSVRTLSKIFFSSEKKSILLTQDLAVFTFLITGMPVSLVCFVAPTQQSTYWPVLSTLEPRVRTSSLNIAFQSCRKENSCERCFLFI